MKESEKAYVVQVDVPSVPKDKLQVSLEKGVLRIAAEFESEKQEDGEKYHWVERKSGSMSRSIKLPSNIDQEGITASSENGVCTITIPKVNAKKADVHTIAVE